MIEKKFVRENVKEFQIQEYISQSLKNVGHSRTILKRTPLGEKIIIFAAKPGLVVGKKGENIKKLTQTLKKKFHLDNPQIEISEVENPLLDAQIVAERIASTLEKYGVQRFKAIGHRTLQSVMEAGARGIEILIAGKVPSARAKRWRFYEGYLKKSGELAVTGVRHAYASAQLKTGTIGIQVSIMPPDLVLPDDVKVRTESEISEAKIKNDALLEKKEKSEKSKKSETPKKKSTRKKSKQENKSEKDVDKKSNLEVINEEQKNEN
ncbi:30S ribosomal protein S3 [Candidatus Woesearchaeota archaeon]|nr:30S ribosomal protein S3 [Candidatus Woesearchaeota archaeon]